jgi:integrase
MVERAAVNRDVVGSSPTSGAIFIEEIKGSSDVCTDFAQQNTRSPDRRVTFPVKIKFRDQTATIYRPAKGFPFYRLAFKVAGRRRMLTFSAYGEAKAEAEKKLRELHNGQQSAALTAKESQDAISIRDMLTAYRQDTGKRISANEAVSDYLAAVRILPKGSTLIEAVRVYARTIGSVKPKAIAEAISEFVASRKGKEAKPGERARFSPVYARNVETWLTRFSEAFPGHLVSDLTPDFIEKYLKQFSELSEKARNDRRGAIGMWLRWCGRKDLIESHQLGKLLACDAMQNEVLPAGKIDFYTPGDLREILDASDGALRVVTALQAFGGARLEEALRLSYEDLRRMPGHIEISGLHAKTRKRRLLKVGPALAQWLASFKGRTGAIWDGPLNSFITEWARLRESVGVPSKRNGLRHGFVSYSYILRGEIETSALAGTSPQILHQNYRGLATRAEAKKWFNVKPPASAKTKGIK